MKRISLKVFLVPALSVPLLLLVSSVMPLGLAQSQAQSKSQPSAQAPAKREWLSINVVRVKPEMLTEWQDFQKNEVIPTLQKGGVKQRHVWQTAVFGESYEYVLVTPIESFAQYDGDSPIIKALGQEGSRAYGAKARRLIASSHTYAVQTRPDLSYEGKMTGPPKLAVVTSIRAVSGRNLEFENFIKNDILPVMKRAEPVGYFVSQIVYGGDLNEYVTLELFNNFADLDKGRAIVRVLGQDGANKLIQKTAGTVVHAERAISWYNAELSFGLPTPPQKAENK